MNEHSFRKSFENPAFKKAINWSWKIHDSFAGGVPDSYVEGSKSDLWIEYKWCNLPKRDTTLIDLSNPNQYLSKLQQEWLRRRFTLGRNDACVILGHDLGCNIFFGLSWETPLTKNDLLKTAFTKVTARNHILNIVTSVTY